MNLIARLKNLWKLSSGGHPHSGQLDKNKVISLWDKIESESPIVNPIDRNKKATFIPRIPVKPIDRINNLENES